MKTKLVALAVVVLFVCGAMVYVHASSDASSTELSISASPESTPLASGDGGCSKSADSDKPAEKKACPKSGSDKSEGGCSKSKGGCSKSKK